MCVKLRNLIRLYSIYMGHAAENCDMNHVIDHGEWSCGFDEQVYFFWTKKFLDELQRINVTLEEFFCALVVAEEKSINSNAKYDYYSIRMSLLAI